MKIKDVITQTGLTDRAIRLYIDNELIRPDCSETYSGRKNLEFSPVDVERLRQIALLRKAGFTLADIKNLQQGGDAARLALADRITDLRYELDLNARVLEALEQLNTDEAVTVEAVCQQLNDAVSEKALPVEDTRPTKAEMTQKITFRIIGTVGALISGFLQIALILYYHHEFIFLKVYPFNHETFKFALLQRWFILQFIFSLIILLITFICPRTCNKKQKRRTASTTTLSLMSVVLFLSMAVVPVALLFSVWTPPVYSHTKDPSNYLILDNYVQIYATDIYEVFPEAIPPSASEDGLLYSNNHLESTKYYYKHEELFDPSFNIYAEWSLNDADYEKAKQDAADISYTPTATVQKGNWHCVYYEDTEDSPNIDSSFYFLIFSYNDETQTVRYIIDYCMDAADGDYQPYYYELIWE